MAKVEVQIRSCFCCGLSLGSVFVALYTLLLYLLLLILAIWGLSETTNHGDELHSHYRNCEDETNGKIPDNRKLQFHEGQTTIIVEDSTTYHCSWGLYTEELKFSKDPRYSWLVFDIILYSLLILASIILLVGLAIYSQWLLIPWILLMAVDIIRGTISTIFVFVLSYGNLARIATGIFFLGLQLFHISILLIIIAKFQRIHNRNTGYDDAFDGADKQYDPRGYPTSTLPSNYAYSPQMRREAYGDYSPTQKDPRYFDQGYGRSIPRY